MSELTLEEIATTLRERIDQAVVAQDLDVQSTAAIITMCQTLVRADPARADLIADIRQIAQSQARERARHNFEATLPWIALDQQLP